MGNEAPIAFRAALPASGTTLREAGGECFLTLAIPETDVQVIYDNVARLRNQVFYVSLIPEHELAEPIGTDRKRGRRRAKVDDE